MSVLGSTNLTVTSADDVTVTPYAHAASLGGLIFRVVLGDPMLSHAIRLTPAAAESLYRQLGAFLVIEEAEAREAARPALPDDPTETLADRLTTEFLHDVNEGRQP